MSGKSGRGKSRLDAGRGGFQTIFLLKLIQGNIKVRFTFISQNSAPSARFANQIVVLHQEWVVNPSLRPETIFLAQSVPEIWQGWLESFGVALSKTPIAVRLSLGLWGRLGAVRSMRS